MGIIARFKFVNLLKTRDGQRTAELRAPFTDTLLVGWILGDDTSHMHVKWDDGRMQSYLPYYFLHGDGVNTFVASCT